MVRMGLADLGIVRTGRHGLVVVARKGAIRQAWQSYVRHFNVLRTNARLQSTALRIRPEGIFNFPQLAGGFNRPKKQRNKTMSKKMRGAYTALRMKDALGYYAEVAIKIAVLAFAFSLAVVQTDMFAKAVAVSVVIAVVSGCLALAAFLCGKIMLSLGFTEVELERWGLA